MFEFFVAIRHLMSRDRRALISVITGISILGVVVGVAALVSVIAVMDGAKQDYFKQLTEVFAHIEIYQKASYGEVEPIKDYKEILKIIASDPDVIAAAPILKRPAALRVASTKDETPPLGFAMVMGIVPNAEGQVTGMGAAPENTKNVRYHVTGQPVPPERGIVMGFRLAEKMGVKPGDSVTALTNTPSASTNRAPITPTKLNIVGTFKSGIYDIDRQVVYTSLATCQKMNILPDVADLLHAKIKDPFNANVVRNRIMAKLETKFGDNFTSRTWSELNPGFFQALNLQRLALFIILLLIVIVAALNIISTLFLVTMEKTREIGVLRAMGASHGSIGRIFLIEGALIGFVGTFLGVLLGFIVCYFLKYHFPIELPESVYSLNVKGLPILIKWTTILEIIGSSVGISLLASVIPAIQAARLAIVEALRYE